MVYVPLPLLLVCASFKLFSPPGGCTWFYSVTLTTVPDAGRTFSFFMRPEKIKKKYYLFFASN
jgi:hypothetical protein